MLISKSEGKMMNMNAVWVNLSLKYPITYLMPKPYITSLEDLFDLEGGDVPKLVENNMTNKPIGP